MRLVEMIKVRRSKLAVLREQHNDLQQQVTTFEQQMVTLKKQVTELHSSESRIQKRLRAQLRYWLEKQTRIPDIIVQDELQPEIGTEYTLLELQPKDGSPIMLGGNMNLVSLALGDVVVIACVCTDHKGSEARFFSDILRGPLEDPYFILEPLVITSGTKVVFQATQGHSRPFTYTFYRW